MLADMVETTTTPYVKHVIYKQYQYVYASLASFLLAEISAKNHASLHSVRSG